MKKKFYKFNIVEHNGEQEYSWPMGCWANTENGAIKLARAYAKRFYDNYDGKPKEVEQNMFEFSCGIMVEMEFCGESDYNDFKKSLVLSAVLNPTSVSFL
jgi:hypothetical protein